MEYVVRAFIRACARPADDDVGRRERAQPLRGVELRGSDVLDAGAGNLLGGVQHGAAAAGQLRHRVDGMPKLGDRHFQRQGRIQRAARDDRHDRPPGGASGGVFEVGAHLGEGIGNARPVESRNGGPLGRRNAHEWLEEGARRPEELLLGDRVDRDEGADDRRQVTVEREFDDALAARRAAGARGVTAVADRSGQRLNRAGEVPSPDEPAGGLPLQHDGPEAVRRRGRQVELVEGRFRRQVGPVDDRGGLRVREVPDDRDRGGQLDAWNLADRIELRLVDAAGAGEAEEVRFDEAERLLEVEPLTLWPDQDVVGTPPVGVDARGQVEAGGVVDRGRRKRERGSHDQAGNPKGLPAQANGRVRHDRTLSQTS